jgi:Kazal-type serine protease inhibitor domain
MRFTLIIILAVFIAVQVKHHELKCYAVSYDCNEGCDLDPTVSGESVCGEDGITYFNECLATCQVSCLPSNTTGSCVLTKTCHDLKISIEIPF